MADRSNSSADDESGFPDYRRQFGDRVRDVRKPEAAKKGGGQGGFGGASGGWLIFVVLFGVIRGCASFNSSSRSLPDYEPPRLPPITKPGDDWRRQPEDREKFLAPRPEQKAWEDLMRRLNEKQQAEPMGPPAPPDR